MNIYDINIIKSEKKTNLIRRWHELFWANINKREINL